MSLLNGAKSFPNSNSDVQVFITFPNADKDGATKLSVDLEQQIRLFDFSQFK